MGGSTRPLGGGPFSSPSPSLLSPRPLVLFSASLFSVLAGGGRSLVTGVSCASVIDLKFTITEGPMTASHRVTREYHWMNRYISQ